MILQWNPKTNEFEEIPISVMIEEYEKELKFYRDVAKYTKKVHIRKRTSSWVKYLEGEIHNMKVYEKWKKEQV